MIDDLYASIAQVSAETFALRLQEILAADVCDRCATIAVPVLYLQATRDRLLGDRDAQAIRERCPQFELHQIDAPHMLLQREPAQAIAVIRDFLSRHKISWTHP